MRTSLNASDRPASPFDDPAGRGFRARSDRRALLKRASAAGLALSAVGGLTQMANADAASPMNPAMGGAAGPAQPFTIYDPVLPAVKPGPKNLTVTMQDATRQIATGVNFAAWTFDGAIPGQPLRAVVGDPLTVTVQNEATTAHSLDLHAAQTPPNKNYREVLAGHSYQWHFTPAHPGAFMYHCGTPPTLFHVAAGLYGAIIIDPPGGWPPAQELILVHSEFYVKPGPRGIAVPDFDKVLAYGAPDHIAFNGHASQYVDHPIPVKVGQPIRIFVVNAGPNVWTSFHVIGAIFDRVYVNANPKNVLEGLQSVSIGPGDGACVEFTLPEAGKYTAVNHSFVQATHGASAVLEAS